jgi:Fic family protein
MTEQRKFYTESPKWHEKIGGIHALLERVKISEEQHGDVLRLRKINRILSIHSSTAIEGNRLTLRQVTDVVNNKAVLGPPKDIKEVQNAWRVYNEMENLNPWDVDSFLNAHGILTEALVGESGQFRTVGVAVVRGDGVVMHRGSPATEVPGLVRQLFRWGEVSEAHPLITSSAVHYMIEHIHPFRDGNGRIGRLWQTLILSKWNPQFTWMPVETLVHNNQGGYYKALQDSHADGVDCRPFIDFMMDAIENSLYKFVDIATETKADVGVNVGTNVGANVGINVPANVTINVPINVTINPLADKVQVLLQSNSKVTIPELAHTLGVTERTIKRAIKFLQDNGRLKRVGSRKTGHWEVILPTSQPHKPKFPNSQISKSLNRRHVHP